MREIKFRAWSITNQRWTYFGIKDAPAWVDKAELEQFTGLHDKHGKEIYEGDVVKVTKWEKYQSTNKLLPFTVTARVSWLEKCGCFGYLPEGSNVWADFRYKMADGYEFEVIGNIYEGPELLP